MPLGVSLSIIELVGYHGVMYTNYVLYIIIYIVSQHSAFYVENINCRAVSMLISMHFQVQKIFFTIT